MVTVHTAIVEHPTPGSMKACVEECTSGGASLKHLFIMPIGLGAKVMVIAVTAAPL